MNDSINKFRRSKFLLLLPTWYVLGAAVGILAKSNVVFTLEILAGAWLTVNAIVSAKFVLEISDREIVMRGYLGGPIRIQQTSVATVTYRRAAFAGFALVEPPHFLLTDHDAHSIRVWRWGWRQRRNLFATLGAWLQPTSAEISPETQAHLEGAA